MMSTNLFAEAAAIEKRKQINFTLAILNRPDRQMARGELWTLRWAVEKAQEYNIVYDEEQKEWKLSDE